MSSQDPTLFTAASRTQVEMGVREHLRPRREWAELTVVAVLLAMATFTAIGTATMTVVGDDQPGPQFFPAIVAVLLYAAAIGIAVGIVRRIRAASAAERAEDASTTSLTAAPQTPDAAEPASPDVADSGDVDWRTLGAVLASLVVFLLILEPVGWLLSATALYAAIGTSLGAKRPLTTLGIGLVFSAVTQIAFSLGLGIGLPAGILGGLF